MNNDFFKKLFNSSNKKFKADIFAIFITGIILLIITSSFFKNERKDFQDFESKSENVIEEDKNTVGNDVFIENDIERKMSLILSEIEGAGNTKVMITLKNTSEKIIAKDIKEEIDNENGNNINTQRKILEETTISMETKDGRKEPFVISENMPNIEGALIVSQGANNANIKSAIIEATEALLGIPSHKIAVFKMK